MNIGFISGQFNFETRQKASQSTAVILSTNSPFCCLYSSQNANASLSSCCDSIYSLYSSVPKYHRRTVISQNPMRYIIYYSLQLSRCCSIKISFSLFLHKLSNCLYALLDVDHIPFKYYTLRFRGRRRIVRRLPSSIAPMV